MTSAHSASRREAQARALGRGAAWPAWHYCRSLWHDPITIGKCSESHEKDRRGRRLLRHPVGKIAGTSGEDRAATSTTAHHNAAWQFVTP
jgi:hypothetical protein